MIELAAGIVLVIAGIHLVWATGVPWPARDGEQLAQWVLGGAPGVKLPGKAACVGVVGALGALAMVWLWAGRAAQPAAWIVAASWLGVGIFGVRGVVGFFDARLRPSIKGSPYAKMNVALYSPLCLVMAALAATDLLR